MLASQTTFVVCVQSSQHDLKNEVEDVAHNGGSGLQQRHCKQSRSIVKVQHIFLTYISVLITYSRLFNKKKISRKSGLSG